MKRVLVLFAILLCGINCICEEKNHVIISIDLKSQVMKYYPDYAIEQIKGTIPWLLEQHGIREGYASVQFFSAEEHAESLDEYVLNINSPFSEFFDAEQILDSLGIDDVKQHTGTYYSIVSIAKPYSLLKFRQIEPDILVERTFLILVTDYKYNGNDDFYGELKHVKGISPEAREQIMNTIKTVQQNYFYQFIAEKDISYYPINSIYGKPMSGYVSLFEVVPLQQYFSIESVLDFPHKIRATRTKNGYQARFSINQLDNPNYRFVTANALIPVDGFNNERAIQEFGQDYIFDISEELINEKGKDSLTLRFSACVHLLDSVYNHTLLTPNGTKLQGALGLTRSIKIELEENAKILGCISLSDWLYKVSFWTNDQNIAAATWGWLFILIIIAVIILFIWSSTQYRNKNNDVKI